VRNRGEIRSPGVTVVSRTSARMDSVRRSRRIRVSGKLMASIVLLRFVPEKISHGAPRAIAFESLKGTGFSPYVYWLKRRGL
jgi:hypothetical protein